MQNSHNSGCQQRQAPSSVGMLTSSFIEVKETERVIQYMYKYIMFYKNCTFLYIRRGRGQGLCYTFQNIFLIGPTKNGQGTRIEKLLNKNDIILFENLDVKMLFGSERSLTLKKCKCYSVCLFVCPAHYALKLFYRVFKGS